MGFLLGNASREQEIERRSDRSGKILNCHANIDINIVFFSVMEDNRTRGYESCISRGAV